MTGAVLKIYHCLPAPLRSLAAGLRGLQLRRWRYGRETERLVEEALERDHWTATQWESWRQERLASVLHRAATRVPYYREYWSRRRRQGDTASWEELSNWPILEKEPLRAHPHALVADDCNPRRMFHDHTSGTSGQSLDLYFRRKTLLQYYALYEARNRRWYGVSRRDRWAILGGQLVVPQKTRKPPLWVWNRSLNQLYMSSYHLAPDLIPHYLEALRNYRVTYLLGYPSALCSLAQQCLELGCRDVKLRVVVTNAEPVLAQQREVISEAFGCPVRETYGMSENVTEASECPEGRLHLWPELGLTEVVEQDQPAAPGTAGDLICTGLLNADMPLIRYRVGDRGALPAASEQCACGSRLPMLAAVEGRSDDMLYTRDGRQVGRLDPVFKSRLPIREAQIIQESLERIRVLYVPAAGYSPADGESICQRLRERMGDIQVALEAVDVIPRSANGKFRAVLCKLPADQKRRLQQSAISSSVLLPQGSADHVETQ